jgi:hypothetical protein
MPIGSLVTCSAKKGRLVTTQLLPVALTEYSPNQERSLDTYL